MWGGGFGGGGGVGVCGWGGGCVAIFVACFHGQCFDGFLAELLL